MAELNLPFSALDSSTLDPEILEQEAQDRQEMERVAFQLESQGLLDDAARLRSDFNRLNSVRRVRVAQGQPADDVSTVLRRGVQFVGEQLEATGSSSAAGAGRLANAGRSTEQSPSRDLAPGNTDTLLPVTTPSEIFAQQQVVQPAQGNQIVPAVPLQQAPQPDMQQVLATDPQMQQLMQLMQQGTSGAQALNPAIVDSILAQQQAGINMDLAQSLVAPQIQINPLANASVVPNNISATPGTFGGDTALVQSLAPTPQVTDLGPALARNEQNNIQTARTEQRLSEAEMARLISLRDRAADAYRQRIRQIMTAPRNQ